MIRRRPRQTVHRTPSALRRTSTGQRRQAAPRRVGRRPIVTDVGVVGQPGRAAHRELVAGGFLVHALGPALGAGGVVQVRASGFTLVDTRGCLLGLAGRLWSAVIPTDTLKCGVAAASVGPQGLRKISAARAMARSVHVLPETTVGETVHARQILCNLGIFLQLWEITHIHLTLLRSISDTQDVRETLGKVAPASGCGGTGVRSVGRVQAQGWAIPHACLSLRRLAIWRAINRAFHIKWVLTTSLRLHKIRDVMLTPALRLRVQLGPGLPRVGLMV
mmetsp:Transcript_96922/g.221976  ORF Transcript_96922/g.221976 Transcript_96922/m.221976 type:complete len:276 (-) Transcript_96922:299-1126(-)